MEIQEVLINVLTLFLGGGIYKLFNVYRNSKKLKQELKIGDAKVTNFDIKNTESIIELYKNSLNDFKKFYEEKEALLIKNNNELKAQISKLTGQVEELRRSNEDLTIKLKDAEGKLDKFNSLIKTIDKQ